MADEKNYKLNGLQIEFLIPQKTRIKSKLPHFHDHLQIPEP